MGPVEIIFLQDRSMFVIIFGEVIPAVVTLTTSILIFNSRIECTAASVLVNI